MSAPEAFQTIALFGATGQIGRAFLDALLRPSTAGYEPRVRVFLRQQQFDDKAATIQDHARVDKVKADFGDVEQLAKLLEGVDAVVSALNGPGIDAQYAILDAAAQAGVKRFVPSEYGFEHPWRKPGDDWTHFHPYFDIKQRFHEHMLLHPAMMSRKMTFTIIGCGDLYDQPTETYWTGWAAEQVPERYVFPIVGDPDSKYEVTKISDLAQFVVAALASPSLSRDAFLNLVSDVVSQQQIADLVASCSGRPVEPDYVSEEQAHAYIERPETIPERARQSRFDPAFWYIVRLQQGTNKFRRHPSLVHNDLFPQVKLTRMDEYLAATIGRRVMDDEK
ncbi:uncharacterized protein RHOBADRAFT_55834 [Rhodotorula graminis WP1]|uniref:NmrA-like domain-containing protein n=1 Tax=Rhodotorula graminis (strain WP1) TaxID=578459 RepID=A0A0P9GY63_RHOGW|nr:uncharacterized protein RHOBADRAFT_55834 [Rhodotorula graminis WP1]KPV72355.1 hypothetical protein RHOBADRAFT_55834 [Rhodotorula graminis WP1]